MMTEIDTVNSVKTCQIRNAAIDCIPFQTASKTKHSKIVVIIMKGQVLIAEQIIDTFSDDIPDSRQIDIARK